jgi:hypothetical protein
LIALLSAKVVVELAKVHEIQAAVLLHPSLLTVDDIKGQIYCDSFSPYMLKLFYARTGNAYSLMCYLIFRDQMPHFYTWS